MERFMGTFCGGYADDEDWLQRQERRRPEGGEA
jgi:hypothetical protein